MKQTDTPTNNSTAGTAANAAAAGTAARFNIASINCCTEVEGPYRRLCIWFQGCTLHCQGCCNEPYQALTPKTLISLEDLMDIILDARKEYGIEGVTYSGGEPTLQQSLPYLTEVIQEAGLGVISFTGRRYEDAQDALKGCDLVIDGPYIESLKETERKLIGSYNQRLLFITDRYKPAADWFASPGYAAVEVNVGEDAIIANGDPF